MSYTPINVIGSPAFIITYKGGQDIQTVIADTTLTIDNSHYQQFIDTTSAACSIQLPDPTLNLGRELWIIDSGNNSATNNITLVRFAAENINFVGSDLVLAINGGSWRVMCDGANWFVHFMALA